MSLLARKVQYGSFIGSRPEKPSIRRHSVGLSMSYNEKRAPFYYSLRQPGAIFLTFVAALGGWFGRLADSISPSSARKARRQLRRWLRANGLTIVLVSVMMIFAWILAER
jgi:hypothetical protein